ncbi:MAG: DUF6719 family protein [Bradyrhizobium sp.]
MRAPTVSPIMTASCFSLSLLLALVLAAPAHARYVRREQNITSLRLGQRVLVDDGTCPPGQIKEVLGAKMTPSGILVARKCVPRSGPAKR